MKPSDALRAAYPDSTFAEIGLEMLDAEMANDLAEWREQEALAVLPELVEHLRLLTAAAVTAVTAEQMTSALPLVPVSIARAAKLLGRSKTRTLAPAIKAGRIRTIPQGRRRMIPPDELRRLAREGIVSAPRSSRAPNIRRGPKAQAARPSAPPSPGPAVASEVDKILALRQR